jgi:hypothetical protein
LMRIDKLPKIAVISFDHVELGLPGGHGIYPPRPRRELAVVADVFRTWQIAGLRPASIAAYNAAAHEARLLAVAFNRFATWIKIRALVGVAGPSSPNRADGSREHQSQQAAADAPVAKRADTYFLLEHDLAVLARVRDRGTRVIVFESPLAPFIVDEVERTLSANARNVRERLRAACAQFALECHQAMKLPNVGWSDATHPPADALGAWLRGIVVPAAN